MADDPIQNILVQANVPRPVAASAWDAVNAATSADDLTRRLKMLPLSNSVRADLWDAGNTALQARKPSPPPQSGDTVSAAPAVGSVPWIKGKLYDSADAATEALPAAGATLGAIAGGSVTAPSGPGAVAGAIGGAGIGGMAGESLKQLLRRALGFEAPQTSAEAAQDITKQGVTQAVVQAGSEALPMLAKPLKDAAENQYVRALAPTTKVNKAIATDIAPEMIDRGIHGNLDAISEQAGQNAAALRGPLNQAYAMMPAHSTAGAGDAVVQSLENLKSRYIVNGMPANPGAVSAISGVQDIVRQYGSDISPTSLRQLKQVFDEAPAAKGAYAGADLATQYSLKAQKAAANSIRNILHSASPDVNALDKEMSFWLDVQRVTDATVTRQMGQAGGLNKTFTPLASALGGIGGFAAGGVHVGFEAAGVTATAGMMAQAMRAPAWRTVSAVWKDRLADAAARGSVGEVVSTLTRLGLAGSDALKSDHATPAPTQ